MRAFTKGMDFERNLVYDPKEALKKIKPLNLEALILDESSYAYYKREWYDKKHHIFAKIIITQGRKSILYIFISPFINDIDKAFNKHFNIVVDVKKRGFAKVYGYKKNYRSRRENDNLEFHFDDLYLKETDIPKDIWEKYKKQSVKEKDKIERELEKTSRPKKLTLNQVLRGI